jgi:hypothetical protein
LGRYALLDGWQFWIRRRLHEEENVVKFQLKNI